MSFSRLFDVLGMIVSVAGVTVVVGSPHTAGVVRELGRSFSGALEAATGRS